MTESDDKARASAAMAATAFAPTTGTVRISGVGGINDETAFGNPLVVNGSCTTCHDTPNSGNHSVAAPLNIGLADEHRRTPDMPLYTLRNKTTGQIKTTTDPGRALITGRWKDVGRFKGPVLRALAARAPYFHNGIAATLEDVVHHYENHLGFIFTNEERADLVAFLNAL